MPYPALLLNFSPALSLHSALCHHICEIVLVPPQGDVAWEARIGRTERVLGLVSWKCHWDFLFFFFVAEE